MCHRIKTLRTELKILFGISVFSVLIIDLWLNSVPEWFPFGAELGALYYKVCLAFITGLIFYFINVHLESESNKVKTYKYINNKAAKIRQLCDTFIHSLRKIHPVPEGKTFESIDEEITYLSQHINPQNPFQLLGWYDMSFPHFWAAIDFIEKHNKELSRDLLFVKDTIKSDIVEIITDIDDTISGHINLGHGQPSGNTNIDPYSVGIINYKKSCDKLMLTIQEKYKYHQVEYNDKFRRKTKKGN